MAKILLAALLLLCGVVSSTITFASAAENSHASGFRYRERIVPETPVRPEVLAPPTSEKRPASTVRSIYDVCPHYGLMFKSQLNNVDWRQFDGLWFADSTTDVSDVTCEQMIFDSVVHDNSFYSYNFTWESKLNGQMLDLVGELRYIMAAQFHGYLSPSNAPQNKALYLMNVMQADYNKYATIYVCQQDGTVGNVNEAVIILSRYPQGVGDRQRGYILGYVDTVGWEIDVRDLKIFDGTQCPGVVNTK